jgi:Protein of unknown function (DUF1488)
MRGSETYTLRDDGIYFLMQDGPEEVVCQITLEALSQLGRTTGLIGPTEIFETGRDTIERPAGRS